MSRGRAFKKGHRARNASDSSGRELGIFALPLEVRRQIYTSMTTLCRMDHLNFLRTCKRLHAEASESFLSRPLDLADQEELIRFTTLKSQAALKHVQELSLHLTDIDGERMRPYLAQIVMGTSKMTFEDPYQLETRRITCALQALPNVKSFSIMDAAKPGRTSAPRLLLNNVLYWAAQHYTSLTHLRIDSQNVSLEPLASCRSLLSLQIPGFSETPAPQMAVIFQGLTNLVELRVTAYRRQSRYFQCRDAERSIDSETFRHIHPLRILNIHDFARLANKEPGFLTVDMLRVISEVHSHSLRQFCVSSITPLEPAVVSQLADTLCNLSRIQTLALTWPEIESEFLGCLPSSAWSLKLFLSDQAHAAEMLDTLLAISYKLSTLRKVHFVTSGTLPRTGVSSAERGWSFLTRSRVRRSKQRLPPWTATWSVWQPARQD